MKKKHGLIGRKMPEEQKKKISNALKKYVKSIQHRKSLSKALSEDKSYKWKGDKVGYGALHSWVRRKLGKPNFCEHCGNRNLKNRQYHWANKSGKYLRRLSDWIRLCVKCHKKYDNR